MQQNSPVNQLEPFIEVPLVSVQCIFLLQFKKYVKMPKYFFLHFKY